MSIDKYLKAVKAKTVTGTTYAAAKLLGIRPGTVQNWKLRNRTPDPFACMKISRVLGIPMLEVLATVEAEKEKDPQKAKEWDELAKLMKRLRTKDAPKQTASIIEACNRCQRWTDDPREVKAPKTNGKGRRAAKR